MAKIGAVLLNLAGIGPAKVKKIIEYLPDLDRIAKLKNSDLGGFSFLTKKDIDRIISLKNSKILENELKLIEKNKIKVIDFFETEYPYYLKQINYPPLVLYLKGNVDLLDNESVAIVGTRTPTKYGKLTAFNFAYKLCCLGLNIVSGLALGIDKAAHEGALAASGSTVGVLGSGLNCIYPSQNRKLARSIFEKGLMVSEYPLNTKPLASNFPRRNRIISGLSKGVVVIEAAQRSGALITANFALGQNREVFAVPGKIDQFQSKGPHSLIKEGAKLTESVEDILEELKFESLVKTEVLDE
ncbi:MAG: DNA-processing protein DprA [Candidatus Omnitrophica bacterium]|nr:DNA-processing protein DprA [Candidatus Omnitrophota bacterium]MCF7892461.1 DNA-processing protein DprA [Candidatus Omnitrophota bacterium]MCF7896070.1 DNA-processing protein DprA [Candidatus Omnitrophota bacterium]MCF7898253.1 DNA-processing protein DprA [Candidatus Omnitrophota bacterium]MCF7909970.1 DNA-processing protein DprA [Candidatus Omnitrophota bacterium]